MPVAILDSQGKGVDVMGVFVIHQMPLAVAERFSDLIRTVEDIVEQATLPVLERLRTWLKGRDAAAIDSWELPEIIDALDSDFTAAHRRKRAPQFTAYWRVLEENCP